MRARVAALKLLVVPAKLFLILESILVFSLLSPIVNLTYNGMRQNDLLHTVAFRE